MKKSYFGLLLSPDPAEGTPPVTDQAPPVPATPPARPPAAETVIEGDEDEETVKLREDLEKERKARKKVEIEHAALTDENKRLKDAGAIPPTTPAKKSKSATDLLYEEMYGGEET